MNKLVLERRGELDLTGHYGTPELGVVAMTAPIVNEGYWKYRVRLSDEQAVVGFPKFGTIGIGFAVEEDWNTNLPCTSDTVMIANHIMHNKGDDSIPESDVLLAIAMIRKAVKDDGGPDAP